MAESIYRRPEDYDLEHEHDERDVAFYGEITRRLGPSRILDLACGNGRITLPLACLQANRRCAVVGVDREEAMLAHARKKTAELGSSITADVAWCLGDMRSWTTSTRFDLVLITCSSISHLLSLQDRVAVWNRVYNLLASGGRFIVDVTMPDLRAYTESLATPPRALLEMDSDVTDPVTGVRLIRYKSTHFEASQQHATITFVYDRFEGDAYQRYVSDFESHVYFPEELRLLFLHTGFEIEHEWADYAFRAPLASSRELIIAGRRP